MDGPKDREVLKKRNKSRSHLITTSTDGSNKLDVAPAATSASPKPKRTHRYSNSAGRSTDWDAIIAAAEEPGKDAAAPIGAQRIELSVKSPLRVLVHSSQVSKAGDLPTPSKSGTPRRPIASTSIISSASKFKTTSGIQTTPEEPELEDSAESESSIVIHPEDQVLSDEEEHGGTPGGKSSLSQTVQIPRLALGELSSPAEETTITQPKLRAHAMRPRLGPVHVNKSTTTKFELRTHRQAIGPTWLTQIPSGETKRPFIISTLEDMYLGSGVLNSQKLISRGLKSSASIQPLLKAWPTPGKSPLPDDLGDLDEEIEDPDDEGGDSPVLSRSNASNPPLRSSGGVANPSSALQVNIPTKVFSAPSSPSEVLPLPSIPGAFEIPAPPTSTSNAPSKRPNAPGILSSIVGKIKRYSPGSPAPNLASAAANHTSVSSSGSFHTAQGSPAGSGTSIGPDNGSASSISSSSTISAVAPLTSAAPVAPESRLGQLRRMFKPWERIRRLKASSDVVGAPLKEVAMGSAHGNHHHLHPNTSINASSEGRLSEAEEGSLRGSHGSHSDTASQHQQLLHQHHQHSGGGSGPPASGRMLHKAHATNRLSTTIESEAIRGPYFQRLQAGSKYMDLVSENIDNLREVTSEDLAAINDSLDRLSTGYETLEIRFKKLSRQMEDTKHRLQSSKALLYDNIHKTSNAIQHLNAKQQSNPFMKALLAVLGWVILIVGTLIWLFAATFRAAMRTVRYIQNIFTGKKQQPSHTSSSTPKRPDMARLPITKMPSNPAKSEMTSSSIKNSGDSYPDSIPPRSGSKPSSLHNSSHDISRSTGGSSTASIGSSRGDEDDSSFASDEDDSRWTPSKLASPPVQLETHQLQTLEDMSKSIKALRNQELAAKRRLAAAAEKSKQVSARNPTSTPNAPQQ